MGYDYIEGKKRIYDILDSKTKIQVTNNIPKQDSEFTYENGIKAWVGSIFVDIVDSSSLFKDYDAEKVARIIRAFCSEIIEILRLNDQYVQIGIRGDCVYAIYSVSTKEDLKQILSDAIMVNTFQKMFQKILKTKQYTTFDIGIGLGASQDLIVKGGRKGTGISDYIWIGDAVVDASKLSSQGNRDSFEPICLSSCFFENISEFNANDDYKYNHYFNAKYSYKLGETVYHGDMINCAFNNWIDGGMNG